MWGLLISGLGAWQLGVIGYLHAACRMDSIPDLTGKKSATGMWALQEVVSETAPHSCSCRARGPIPTQFMRCLRSHPLPLRVIGGPNPTL
jgi:hypothetical protein